MAITNNLVEEVGPVESGWAEPVTLDEVKLHIKNNTGDAEDALIEQQVSAARQQFEFSTDGRIAIATTFRQWLTSWPTDKYGRNLPIPLQRGKVTEVDSVTYWGEDDQEQDLEDWSADLVGIPALVYTEAAYPALSPTRPRPVCIEYTAGWTTAAEVPADVKLAICLLAAEWYSQREAYTEGERKELPMGFLRLCNKYKTGLQL